MFFILVNSVGINTYKSRVGWANVQLGNSNMVQQEEGGYFGIVLFNTLEPLTI